MPALFAQWVPTLLRTAGVTRGTRVLDVACGTGVVARGAAELVGPSGRVSGVDLNPAMIAVARGRAPDLDWRVADAGDLPYPDGAFDVVLCQSALFFFPDIGRAVREMARVLDEGGVVKLAGVVTPTSWPDIDDANRSVDGCLAPTSRLSVRPRR